MNAVVNVNEIINAMVLNPDRLFELDIDGEIAYLYGESDAADAQLEAFVASLSSDTIVEITR